MANLTHALELAKSLVQEKNLIGWRVITNNKKRSFGTCNYRQKTIELSARIIPHCTEDAVWNTITHEVAHALAGPYAHHDYTWQRIHRELGGNGERCGGAENYINGTSGQEIAHASISAYIGVCPNGHKHFKHRMPKNQHSCGKCSRHFDSRYLITYTKNTER